MSSIFGGDTGLTYEQAQAKRKIAQQLMAANQGAPRNVGEGLHAIGRAIAGRALEKRADAAENRIRERFETDIATAIPSGMQQYASLYDHPMAGKGQRKVLEALMSGAPGFARGTGFAPGGVTVVGEDGPEVVNLPRGAQVVPNPMTALSQAQHTPPAAQPFGADMNQQEIYDRENDLRQWRRKFQEDLGDHLDEFLNMPGEQQRQIIDQYNNGVPVQEFMNPEPDPRGMFFQEDSRFDDANAFQTADSGKIELPYGDAKLTGDQSKSVTYYRRGFGANQTLNDPKMAEALLQYTDTFAKNFGGVGRAFQDADFQVADRAAREFLAAILRKDTGAAITNEEFRLYGPMYLPQPGDKPELLEAKKKAREEALIGIEMGLGTASHLAAKTREELATPQDLGALSDDDLLKMLQGGQ